MNKVVQVPRKLRWPTSKGTSSSIYGQSCLFSFAFRQYFLWVFSKIDFVFLFFGIGKNCVCLLMDKGVLVVLPRLRETGCSSNIKEENGERTQTSHPHEWLPFEPCGCVPQCPHPPQCNQSQNKGSMETAHRCGCGVCEREKARFPSINVVSPHLTL